MIVGKQYEQAEYRGWKLPETCTEVDGTLVARQYGNDKTKTELLLSDEWKLPDVMTMNDGRPVTKELWQERRQELLRTIMEYGFGYTPEPPDDIRAKVLYNSGDKKELYADVVKTYAGKAVSERIMLSFDAPYGEFSFPIHLVRPIYAEKKPPVIIHLSFSPSLMTLPVNEEPVGVYAPIEEIIDNGFCYVQMCYNDIIGDIPKESFEEDFLNNGMGRVFFKGGCRGETEWGKIGMWAYAASRIVDYLMQRADVDTACISVAGHSRLGKTALWCAAQDERIFAALVNGSGFGGAGLMKNSSKNRLKDMIKNGRIDWWNEKIKQYADDPTKLPYDGHSIVACVSPRYVNLLDGDGDFAYYQLSDFMSAAAASPAYEINGVDGFVSSEELPHPTIVYNSGHIGYSLRPGSHYLSRWDWNSHMQFIKLHRNKNR